MGLILLTAYGRVCTEKAAEDGGSFAREKLGATAFIIAAENRQYKRTALPCFSCAV
ncbi:MAG: hypothetical protein LBU34_10575 [Planctomycetaceae bacterium]|nr:hypothetical protein [Planctomycetaceae bacterium]